MDSYPQPGAHGSYRLTSHYASMAIRDLATQLSKAGVRLVWLLNRALGSASWRELRTVIRDAGRDPGSNEVSLFSMVGEEADSLTRTDGRPVLQRAPFTVMTAA